MRELRVFSINFLVKILMRFAEKLMRIAEN